MNHFYSYHYLFRSEIINNIMSKPFSTSQFIEQATKKFGSKFDYSRVQYKNANTKISIICPEHGEFIITPYSHLNSLHGCKKCGTSAMAEIQKEITHRKFNEFVKTSRYDYSKSVFDKITDKITIICPEHGEFQTTVDHHIRGTGCKKCADQNKTGGYNDLWFDFDSSRKHLPGILYVLEMYSESERFIKIGMTKNTVEYRYRGLPYKFNILKLWYGPLYECYQKELSLKNTFFKNLYRNSKNIFITESFNIDLKDKILEEVIKVCTQ